VSQLVVSASGQSDFYLNVLNFDSPVFGEMNSGQTRTQIQYFPIKAMQPELICDVIFPSELAWEQWQYWVRQHMLNMLNTNYNSGSPGVTLNWPERSINNWTALIPTAKAGGMRRNYTPRVRITFQLIVSLVSSLDIFFSFGSAWQGLFGMGANLDSILTLPENVQGGAVTPGTAGAILGGGATGPIDTSSSLIPGLSPITGAAGG
jgi:hypothetical protein